MGTNFTLMTKSTLLEAIASVANASGKGLLVDSGYIKNLQIFEGEVILDVVSDSAALAQKKRLEVELLKAIHRIDPKIQVKINLEVRSPAAAESANLLRGKPIAGVEHVVAVASGKGGVGKSTLASAEAVRAALAGDRVLVVSTDQAHSLGDVLGVAVPASGDADPVRILTEERGRQTGGGRLDAVALDTLALLESMWRAVAPALALRFPSSDLNELAPEELCALPGIQEVLGLRAVADLADSGRWDYVVVDCASTADALRMLTLPAVFGDYLERCWPRHRRLSAALEDVRTAAAVALAETAAAAVGSLSALLTDTERVCAHLVLTP